MHEANKNNTFFLAFTSLKKKWYFNLHIVATNMSTPENKTRNRILTKCIIIKSIHIRTKATYERTAGSSEHYT